MTIGRRYKLQHSTLLHKLNLLFSPAQLELQTRLTCARLAGAERASHGTAAFAKHPLLNGRQLIPRGSLAAG